MTPWLEFSDKEVETIPAGLMGVFQLARGESNIAFVGRADEDLRQTVLQFLGKGYTHFQWTQVPWPREGFLMQCRLYHHAGGRNRLDNPDHPYPPEGKVWFCPLSSQPAAICEG